MYYDGTKLLSLKDLDGETPEIFLCTSNRSGGKTTYFSRYLVNNFKKRGEYFLLLYRYKYEISNCHSKFFNEIRNLFFTKDEMTSKTFAKQTYAELYLNDVLCGFATSLNCAENLKKYSHVFSNVSTIFMDEFQSENNQYTDREIEKFISIHTSVARGGGKQSRYVKCILSGNPVSIINPYYSAMNIGYRLQNNTKFLRGKGWVLEQGFNDSANKAQSKSRFNKVFSDTEYMAYNTTGAYLNDNYSMVENKQGKNIYLCTLFYNNKYFNVRYFPDDILYCNVGYDKTFPLQYAVKTHIKDIPLYKQAPFSLQCQIKNYFENGKFRFKNLECKECIFNLF